jgi:hypothetical protein
MNCTAGGSGEKYTSTRPASTSVSASGAPLNGTICPVKPAARRNRSMVKCGGVPMPAAA